MATILTKYIDALEKENLILIIKGHPVCQTEFYVKEPTTKFPRPWRVVKYGNDLSDGPSMCLICSENGGHYDDIVAKNVPLKIARAIVHEVNFHEALDPSEF